MDLHAAQLMRGKPSALSRATSIACFGLACALLIGSLISPGKAHTNRLANAADPAITQLPH